MQEESNKKGMRFLSPVGALALAVVLATIAVAVLVSFRLSSRSEPIIDDYSMRTALASTLPEKLTMSDEIEFFERRLERNSGDNLALVQLVNPYLLRFKAYGNVRDLEQAKKYLAIVLKKDPSNPSLHATLSSISLSEHRFGKAIETAQKAIALSDKSRNGVLYLQLFEALMVDGRYTEAEKLLDLSFLDRKSFGYLVSDARLQDKLGNLGKAKLNIQKALDQARAYAQPAAVIGWCLVELGHLELHTGNVDEAAKHFFEALEQLQGYPPALEGIAWISYTVDSNLPNAKLLYQRARENGGELDIYIRLIEIEERLGNQEKADENRNFFFKEATRDSVSERLFYRPLALLLSQQHEMLLKALRYARLDLANRRDSESYDVLSWVLYQMGQLEGAYDASQKALAWGKPEPSCLYHAGMILWKLGQEKKAGELLSEALETSIELGPADEEECRRTLDSL